MTRLKKFYYVLIIVAIHINTFNAASDESQQYQTQGKSMCLSRLWLDLLNPVPDDIINNIIDILLCSVEQSIEPMNMLINNYNSDVIMLLQHMSNSCTVHEFQFVFWKIKLCGISCVGYL